MSMESPLLFPLTDEEIERLKGGEVLLKHYHNVFHPEDTIAVVLGKNWKRGDYDYLLPRGIDVAGVKIGQNGTEEEFFDMLETGVWMSRQTGPGPGDSILHVAFMKQWYFEELKEKKK